MARRWSSTRASRSRTRIRRPPSAPANWTPRTASSSPVLRSRTACMDMWSLMAFAMPGVLGSAAPTSRSASTSARTRSPRTVWRPACGPFLLRRTKSAGGEGPSAPDRGGGLREDGGDSARDLYKAELKRIQKALLGLDSDEAVKKNSFAILQGLMRLRQICCHPGLIDPKYLKEESAKINSLFYLLDQLREEGHKVLVFSQFRLDARHHQDPTGGREHGPSTTSPARPRTGRARSRSFQTTKDAVRLPALAEGRWRSGLNLTSASYVILYDPWWNPAVENQAIDRTHRIGQKNKVIAYRLLTRDSRLRRRSGSSSTRRRSW